MNLVNWQFLDLSILFRLLLVLLAKSIAVISIQRSRNPGLSISPSLHLLVPLPFFGHRESHFLNQSVVRAVTGMLLIKTFTFIVCGKDFHCTWHGIIYS